MIGFFALKSPEMLYSFETSIASSILKSGNIVEKALLSIVFQLPGGPSMTILCPHEAAISKALFACSCPKIYLKSKLLFKLNDFFHSFTKSNFSAISKSIHPLSICLTSHKLSTAITSIPGITEASFAFIFGTNILLNHFSFAHIVAGSTEATFLSLQSSDNSQIKTELSIYFSSINHSFNNIQIAIGKSKLGPTFLIFAGAKLTVILVIGSLFQIDLIAERILSLLS